MNRYNYKRINQNITYLIVILFQYPVTKVHVNDEISGRKEISFNTSTKVSRKRLSENGISSSNLREKFLLHHTYCEVRENQRFDVSLHDQ